VAGEGSKRIGFEFWKGGNYFGDYYLTLEENIFRRGALGLTALFENP
jgi:hypothetical protein